MWISKKRWEALEKKVADLEEQVQSQPKHFSLCGIAEHDGCNVSVVASALASELEKLIHSTD